jgi:hypothetical protein
MTLTRPLRPGFRVRNRTSVCRSIDPPERRPDESMQASVARRADNDREGECSQSFGDAPFIATGAGAPFLTPCNRKRPEGYCNRRRKLIGTIHPFGYQVG